MMHGESAANGPTDRDTTDWQVAMDLWQDLTKNLSAKFQIIYGELGTNIDDPNPRKDLYRLIMRCCLTYKF